MVMSYPVGAGKELGPLKEQPVLLTPEPALHRCFKTSYMCVSVVYGDCLGGKHLCPLKSEEL